MFRKKQSRFALVEEVKENEAKMEALENKNRKKNNIIALHIIQNQRCAPKSSAGVDGGLSGGSSMCRPGSEDPHQTGMKQ